MAGEPASNADRVRAAEIIGVLSLATDFGMGLPLEHGLQSTLVAMRLCERLGVDAETTAQTYYGCLLFYVGCTVDADVMAETFPDGALLAHFSPVMFGSSIETMAGIMRALSGPDTPAPLRVLHVATRLPKAVSGHPAQWRTCSPTSPSAGTASLSPGGSRARRSRSHCG